MHSAECCEQVLCSVRKGGPGPLASAGLAKLPLSVVSEWQQLGCSPLSRPSLRPLGLQQPG